MRRLPLSLAIAGLLVLATGCTSAGGGTPAAPLDARFTRLDGTAASLADYRGRPLVVNFWASTCGPCVTEMPDLEKVKQATSGKVAFLGMNVQESVAAATSFIDQVKVTWDMGRDPDGSLLQGTVGGIGLPTTVVLDREGHMVFKHLGQLSADELRTQLDKLGFT